MLPTFQEQIHHLVDSLWIISRFKHRREDEELFRAYIYIMNLIVYAFQTQSMICHVGMKQRSCLLQTT